MECPIKGDNKKKDGICEIFFFRQFLLCGLVIINYFIFGLYMGAITVLVPQLRKEANSTEAVTPEMASWLSSISAFCATPWVFILLILTYRFGRKPSIILISLTVLLGNVLFYRSSSVFELLVSQAIQGILIGALLTVTVMVLTEFTSPKYRGVFATMKAATFYWGVWVSNAIGTFFHWKNIGILIFICAIFNLILSMFSCESPYWLASKKRFNECKKVHRWLKGTDKNSEEELRRLILLQQDKSNDKSIHKKHTKSEKLIKALKVFREKSFYKSLVYSYLPLILYNATGKVACTVYAIDIIKKITSNERMAYAGMLILDGVTVVAMYLGCALSKIVMRRKQLLVLSLVGISFLYSLSLYLYIIKLDLVSENHYISLVLLIGFTLSVGSGPVILAPCCSAELSPIRNRTCFLCCISCLNNICFALTLKLSPLLFKYCDTSGTFLYYAVASSVALFILYKYLPETKDLTIQEIEEIITRCDPNDKTCTATKETTPLKEPGCT